jgi:hypothetical protein
MTCSLRWVGTKVREPPTFYGQNDLEEFLTKFELEIFESHRLLVLDISLKYTPTHFGVLIRKGFRICINAKDYCAPNLAQNRKINICGSMMEWENLENM